MNKEDLIDHLLLDLVKLSMDMNKSNYQEVIDCDLEAVCDSGYLEEVEQVTRDMHINWDSDLEDYPTDGLSENKDKEFIINLMRIIKKH